MNNEEALSTNFTFTLPRGLADSQHQMHQQGTMRLATARDELWVQQQPKVQDNPAYAGLMMLSRVIAHIGDVSPLTPELLEGLVLRDIAYLQEFYNQVNQRGQTKIPACCPCCKTEFSVEFALLGEF